MTYHEVCSRVAGRLLLAETRTQDDPEHCKLTLIRYDCDASKRNAVYYFNSWPAEERTTNYLIMQNTS